MNLSTASTRREFLSTLSLAGLTFGLGTLSSLSAASAGKIPLGLQLYSLRDQCKKDLPGMLAAVSEIGFKGVEFAGYHGRTAKELRQMLDDHGLVACGTHTPFETIHPGQLKATVEFNRTIGNHFLIVPWMDEAKSKQEWMERAQLFNETAEKLKPEGMSVGYHAHSHDFKEIEGTTAWDLFFGNTHKDVIMQLDTSNCLEGGVDPVAVLNKYPGRVKTIHIKASGGGPDSVIGEDKVNWKAVFEFCESKGGTQWYVLEHETSKDPLDAVTRSYAALKRLGKV